MMPLKDLSKNKLLLQREFNVSELSMDDWPFWMLEENIKVANSIIEEIDKKRTQDEETQKQQMPNMNMGSYTSGINNMMNKFKK